LPAKGTLDYSLTWHARNDFSATPTAALTNPTTEFIWPSAHEGENPFRQAFSKDFLSSGNWQDFTAGYIYFRSLMIYGDDNEYATAICWKISLKPLPQAGPGVVAQMDTFTPCPDGSLTYTR
jgi:hypothetical protein